MTDEEQLIHDVATEVMGWHFLSLRMVLPRAGQVKSF